MRIGFISNTHSGRNRKALGQIRSLLAASPAVVHREVRTPEQIAEALEEFSRVGVDVIALNGGDGTIQSALTTLLGRRLFQPLPPLALLPGGTTNMTAYDISAGRRRLLPVIRKLLRLLANEKGGDWPLVQRHLLRVRAQPDAEPRVGFFFGAGAIIRGMEYFQANVHSKGLKNELGPGLTLLRFLYGVVRGQPEFIGSISAAVCFNGRDNWKEYRSLILFVSTLERFFLGIRPYWGEQNGVMHFTLIQERPRHLLRSLPGILRGRPGRHVTQEAGYHSCSLRQVKLLMDGTFSLDGELYEARREWGPVLLESAGEVRFIRL